MTVVKQPSIAIYVPEGGVDAKDTKNDHDTFDGWRVIKHDSHMVGKWSTALEGMFDGMVMVPAMEAMQQLISAGKWEAPVATALDGRVMLFVTDGNLTDKQERRIVEAKRAGNRVGMVVPKGIRISDKIHELGIVIYPESTLALDPERTNYLLRELAFD